MRHYLLLAVLFAAAFGIADGLSGKGYLGSLSQASILGGPGFSQGAKASSGW